MKKLNKLQKEQLRQALGMALFTALEQDKTLKKFMESKATFLGSEKWIESVLHNFDLYLKVGLK